MVLNPLVLNDRQSAEAYLKQAWAGAEGRPAAIRGQAKSQCESFMLRAYSGFEVLLEAIG